jgi:hypothetical protein
MTTYIKRKKSKLEWPKKGTPSFQKKGEKSEV